MICHYADMLDIAVTLHAIGTGHPDSSYVGEDTPNLGVDFEYNRLMTRHYGQMGVKRKREGSETSIIGLMLVSKFPPDLETTTNLETYTKEYDQGSSVDTFYRGLS
jgi:hypothetical protein